MKAFIDRVFQMKKLKKEKVVDVATEAIVESIVEEVKKETEQVEKPKEEVVLYPKPNHADCKCYKCERWKEQNA